MRENTTYSHFTGKDRVSITQWYNLKTGEWNYANYQFPKAISDSTVAQVDKVKEYHKIQILKPKICCSFGNLFAE